MDEFGSEHDQHLREQEFVPNLAKKVIVDNFDFRTSVHEMTEEHQDADMHWVSMASVINRITPDNLSDKQPPDGLILKISNGIFIPSKHEHALQRENYIDICGKIASENLACIKDLGDIAFRHVGHKYSRETVKPTDTVSSRHN